MASAPPSANVLETIEAARVAIRRPLVTQADVNHHARKVGIALGQQRMEQSSVRAVAAVLDRLDNSAYSQDEEAWTEWETTERTFRSWKQRVLAVLTAGAVDFLSEDELQDLARVGAASRTQGTNASRATYTIGLSRCSGAVTGVTHGATAMRPPSSTPSPPFTVGAVGTSQDEEPTAVQAALSEAVASGSVESAEEKLEQLLLDEPPPKPNAGGVSSSSSSPQQPTPAEQERAKQIERARLVQGIMSAEHGGTVPFSPEEMVAVTNAKESDDTMAAFRHLMSATGDPRVHALMRSCGVPELLGEGRSVPGIMPVLSALMRARQDSDANLALCFGDAKHVQGMRAELRLTTQRALPGSPCDMA
eukprot:5833863-Prymnesium_polylepis.1